MLNKLLLILFILLTIINCTDNVSGGGADDISNGYISGIASTIDSTSVEGSVIKLIPINHNPLNNTISEYLIDTITSNGSFNIGPIDSGYYNLISFSKNQIHSSITEDIYINGNDTILNQELDSSIEVSLRLSDSLYDSANILYFTGTDTYQRLSLDVDTISFKVPSQIDAQLILTNEIDETSDTLLYEVIITDTMIIFIEDTVNDSTSTFFSWNSLGLSSRTPIDMIRDSSDNIWAIFSDYIVAILTSSIDSVNIVYYDKAILASGIDSITCATIAPWNDILIGTNGQGIISSSISSDGVLTVNSQQLSTNTSLLPTDTVTSLGFKKDSLIFIISSDTISYGNYLSDNQLISYYAGANSSRGFFFFDSLVVYISNGQFTEFNLNSSTHFDDVIYFTQGGGIVTSFSSGNDTHVYLGLEQSGNNEAVFFDGQNSLIRRYNLSAAVSTDIQVKSATTDLNNNDWFGMSNGEIVYVTSQNDVNAKSINSLNSKLPPIQEPIISMVINSQNNIYAAISDTGFVIINIEFYP